MLNFKTPKERKRSLREGEAGPGAPIFRDRSGKQIDRETWQGLQKKDDPKLRGKKLKENPKFEQVLEWGAGLVQKQNIESKISEEEKVANQPLSRYDLDDDYDDFLKKQDRWGDPFANAPPSPENNTGNSATCSPERERKDADHTPDQAAVSGPQTAPKPKCRFPAVANRYGIRPGYRWDGVIRGTGYEEKLLKKRNTRHLEETEEYKWSVQDW